jgi:hypothetical protein
MRDGFCAVTLPLPILAFTEAVLEMQLGIVPASVLKGARITRSGS